MSGYRNPAAFLRKAIMQLQGIKKREEWGVYLSVACLCMVISLLLVINIAYAPAVKISSVQGQQHITLNTDTTVPVFSPIPQRKEYSAYGSNAAVEQRQEKPEMTEEAARGDWYFDELHQDWRYKKSE